MRIVVVGSGGREHALGARFVREGHEVVAIPGNPGLAEIARCVPVDANDVAKLAEACTAEKPALVVVGPEAPLAKGLADRLRAAGVPVFGPSQEAARLESSKAFAKDVMQAAGVPTASFLVARDAKEVEAALAKLGGRVAVKADGLAAGKGVVVCDSLATAREAGLRLVAQGPVVIEERLVGPEVSVIALTDGKALAVLPAARDHKRLQDRDVGPNTGGMGAVCPVVLPPGTLVFVRDRVMRPVLAEMAKRGTPFSGALYAGLMLTPQGPKVLEFNARFGDPETQAICAALDATVPLAETCLAAAEGRLPEAMLPASQHACCVVVASAGYPEAPRTGDPIGGIDAARALGADVLHAGTKLVDGRLVSNGGRVLGVVATGRSLDEARKTATDAAERITLPGKQFRRDIGAA